MYVYISQWKYIPYLTSIHALSPYELSHTIIPVTCVYNWFNNRYITSYVHRPSTFSYYYKHIDIQPNLLSKLLLSHPLIILLLIIKQIPLCNAKSSVNNVHNNFNGISHISAIGLVPSKAWLRLTPRGPALRVETHFPLPTACRC